MKVLVINPNTSRETTRRLELAGARAASAGTTIEAVTAPFGPKVIKTMAQSEVAGEAVLDVLDERAGEADVAIIAAFGDPGLSRAQATTRCPVMGMGQAAMLEAAETRGRFSIVTMGRSMMRHLTLRAAEYGVESSLASIRILPWHVQARRPSDIETLTAACADAIQHDGADAVVIGGGPLSGLAEKIETTIMHPVLDGISCALRRAERLYN